MFPLIVWNDGYSQINLNRRDTLNICENYIRLSAFYKTRSLNLEEKFKTESKKNDYLILQNNYYDQKIIKLEEKYEIKQRYSDIQLENEKKNSKHKYWVGLKTGGLGVVILTGLILILVN